MEQRTQKRVWFKKEVQHQTLWHTPIIPALKRLSRKFINYKPASAT
jgi:hypothetical protein